MTTKDVIAQAENRFEEIIGEIPPEAAMQQYGKEFCVMCGHPTKNDKTVNELRNFFFSTYTKDLLQSVKGEIIKWCNQRCEANIRIHGTDKWNGDLEDLIAKLTEETDSIKS